MSKTPEKNNTLGLNSNTLARFALGGVALGGGAAAASQLVKLLEDIRSDAKRKKEPTDTDENTIVLRLPKRASALIVDPKVKVTKQKDKVVSTTLKRSQIRHGDGQYGVKVANWQTLTGSVVAGGAGGALGYYLVNKLAEMRRHAELQKELDAEKEEYLNVLGDVTKAASSTNTFDTLDYPLGIGALALLLGTGGTAWLTKRVLDEYSSPELTRETKAPEVRRIVFKTGVKTDGEDDKDRNRDNAYEDKEASGEVPTNDCVDAALGVFLDVCSGTTSVVGHEKVAAALHPLGYTPTTIYKMAETNSGVTRLIDVLKRNPEVTDAFKLAGMEAHPVFKHLTWARNLPFIKSYSDNKVYDQVANSVGKSLYGTKEAASLSVLASYLGSTAAASSARKERTAASADKKKEKDEETPEERAAEVEVQADDIDAAAYVANNREKIEAMLVALAKQRNI